MSKTSTPLATPASPFALDAAVKGLRAARSRWRAAQGRPQEAGGRELPSREAVRSALARLRGALFPLRLGPTDLRQDNEDYYVAHTLDDVLHSLADQARLELAHAARLRGEPQEMAVLQKQAVERIQAFAEALPDIRDALDADVLAAYDGDPAARSVDEVLLCYPGVDAIIHHRLAHRLHELDLPLLARMFNALALTRTGIDIHPGAQIGKRFFIDHGSGVVIGETAVIGDRVRLYQAVTLGARSFPADGTGRLQKGLPRHPIVEDDVVIYAGATILGRITIGRGSVLGGNVWVTQNVPPGSLVTLSSMRQEAAQGTGAGVRS